MIATVMRQFDNGRAVFAGRPVDENAWALDTDKAHAVLDRATEDGTPLCLLTTAFHCVELISSLQARGRPVSLPKRSRLMETGGYKGRSREVPKQELYDLVTRWIGIEPECVVSEYGMTELSSQAYDGVAQTIERAPGNRPGPGSRAFRFPPWARFEVISTETGRPAGPGEPGLLRVYDLANIRSVLAIQTEDLAVARVGGFELIGRRTGSEPRGCSLMAK